MKESPGHVMILASAGSGKTHALVSRYIRLLASGAPPERIAALTFTRKAAGEFFDKILGRLAGAASGPAAAKRLAHEIGSPELGPPDFGRMLRSVVDVMHRLNLGTIDGFFARIVRAFSLELGLGGEFEILPEEAENLERLRMRRQLLAGSGETTEASRKAFMEAFKRATFGAEEKKLGALLDFFVKEHIDVFLSAPDPVRWGQPGAIWPAGCPWLEAAADRVAAARELERALPWEVFKDGQQARWREFFRDLPEWAPGAPLPQPVRYLLGNAIEAWPEVGKIVVDRKQLALPEAAASALRRVVSAVVGLELGRRLEMTRGLFDVLARYEEVYDADVRRSGRLTFSDLQRLLVPGGPGRARMLSRSADDDQRLFIDWRLDAQIDHWLLDEFQDTSFGQWCVLRNLIDEVVQDPSGLRTFFYVGDAKQALYGWRGGDSRLFREIFDHYNRNKPGTIRDVYRERSFRSGPAVIDTVNRVFGAGEALRSLFPAEVAARWSQDWRDHETELAGLDGFARLHTAPDEVARFGEVLRILQEVRPLERGLSAAVLVQRNATASELAGYLRRNEIPRAVAESDLKVGFDNPLSTGILALFRAAAHPGDRTAWGHLALTPLGSVLQGQGLAGRNALSLHLLREVHSVGFGRTIARWLKLIEATLGLEDPFSRERGRQLAEIGRAFDATGSRDPGEFARYAAELGVRDADSAGNIHVMTVHKAKGLEFDLVILPDLEGDKLDQRRDGLAVQRAPDRSVEWVLDLPSKDFWQADETLSAHVAGSAAEACYESLCLLYVAMTRAKRALHVITQPVGKSESHNFRRLLRDTLGESWSRGNPTWYTGIRSASGPAVVDEDSPEEEVRMPRAPRRPARRPSAGRAGVQVSAAPLFALEPMTAAGFGSAVHALLSEVEWCGDPAAADRFEAEWRGRGAAGAVTAAAACLRAPALARVWARPEGRAEAWRERSFEAVLDGDWVTGVFDRVVVERDSDGRPRAARVFDFKTDRVSTPAEVAAAAETHRAQMCLYRRAAAVLTGLDPEAVSPEIVFTHPLQVVALGS
jgi:ATP-dependent helicase/nuclease subunit A